MKDSTDATPAPPTSKALGIIGTIIFVLVILFFTMDTVLHLLSPLPAPVIESFKTIGFPTRLSPVLGILTLVSGLLYAIPRTSVLGAILLTGYLGGAISIQLRVDGSWVFPVIIGVLAWGALWMRDSRVKALIPLKA